MAFLNKPSVEFLIAGLGNPDSKYSKTRHNSGFNFLDWLSNKTGIQTNKLKHMGLIGKGEINDHSVILVKPQTYMNSSGDCIRDAANYYKIPNSKIIVVFDDISLEVGRVRIRRSGSDGGHNGIKSIIEQLGTNEFPRIKIGVGSKPNPDYDLADWVLSDISASESRLIADEYSKIYDALLCMLDGDTEKAMAKVN
ncbi:MAG: aminoacyl-tRNA hydrolase [Clostridia bacterium]